jgi:hypothetical protein
MTDEIDDGGAAFPFVPTDISNADMLSVGMTLRDWFAGQALAGMLADGSRGWTNWPDHPAIEAYGVADAMLAARRFRS